MLGLPGLARPPYRRAWRRVRQAKRADENGVAEKDAPKPSLYLPGFIRQASIGEICDRPGSCVSVRKEMEERGRAVVLQFRRFLTNYYCSSRLKPSPRPEIRAPPVAFVFPVPTA